jgi:PAS domain S-box-containing protein
MHKNRGYKDLKDRDAPPKGRPYTWLTPFLYIATIVLIISLLLINIFQPDKYNGLNIGLAFLSLSLIGTLAINRWLHAKNSTVIGSIEQSFQNREQTLRALLNAPTESAILIDTDARILAINQVAADRLGKSVEALIGLGIYEYLPPDIAESRKNKGNKVIESGKPLRFSDEREGRIYDNNIYPVFNNEGNVSAIAIYSRDTTDSRLAEQKLKRSEEQYRSLFLASPIVIFNLSPEGKILEFNPEAANLIGWDRVNIIGKNYIELFIPEDTRDAVKQDINKVLDGTPTRNFENPIILPDGSRRLFVWNVDAIYDSQGKSTGIVAVGLDITERKRAEDALRKSEEKFALAFRSNPCPVVISSLMNKRIIDVNDSFVHFSGYKREEAIGHTAHELNLWTIPEQRDHLIKKLKEDGTASDLEYTYQKKSGEIVIGLLSGELIEIENESCLLATFMDITERKKTDQALQESEERFRRLANNAKDMIYRMSLPDGKYEYVSPASVQIWGYTPEEVYNSPLLIKNTIHPDWLDYFKEEWDKLLKGEMPPFYEYKIIHKSGEERWLNQRNVLVRDDDGRSIAIEGIVTDITARKETEEELAKYKNFLESVLSQSPVPMAVAAIDGTLEIINDACREQLLIVDEPEIKNGINLFEFTQTWKDYDSEGNLLNVEDLPLAKALRGLVTRNEEIRVVRKDGSERWELVDGFPIYNKNGEVIAGVIIFPDITERKIAEEALRKSEQKFQNIAQNIPGVVFRSHVRTDGSIYFSYISPRAHDVYGFSSDPDSDEWTSFQRVHPEDRELFLESIDQSIKNVCEWNHEYRLIKPNGETIWIHGISSPTKDGDELTYNGILLDINERKNVEDALRESEQKHQDIARNIPGMIYQFRVRSDGSHYFSYASPRSEELFGMPPDLAAEEWNSFSQLHPEDREQFLQSIEEAAQNVRDWNQEGRTLMPDGEIKWFHGIASPTRIGDEVIFNGILLDITERKMAEEKLREHESILGSIFRASPIGIGLVTNRIINQVNQRICEMTGYSEDELISQSARMLYPTDEDFEFVGIEKYNQIKKYGTGTVETKWLRKDGQVIDVLLSSTPIDQEDLLKGVTFTVLDITDRKRAANEIMREKSFSDGLIRSLPGIFYLFGEDGMMQRWNRSFEEVTGYSGEEISHLNAIDFFTGNDKDLIYSRIQEVFENGQSSVEADFTTKSGEKIAHYFTGTRLESDGKIYVLGVGIDISESKSTTEALRESESRFRNIVESSPMGMHMYKLELDNRLIFTGANPAADYILGISHDQFIGQTIEEAFPGLIESEIPGTYRRIASQGEKWHTEQINYDEGSVKGAYEVHAFQTSPGKMTALFFDITERKIAEESIRTAQALLYSSVEQSPAGILIADAPDVRIRMANSAALGIRGDSIVPLTDISAELHPQNWQTFHLNGEPYKPEDLPLSRAIMEGTISKDVEVIIRRPSGEERLVSANAAPVRDSDGKIIAGVVVFTDITETRRLQKLENRAQRLQTAGQIAGQVAHDFNNLLGPLMAYPELMRDTIPEDHESLTLLDSIEQAAIKMADINQQLLTLGRRGHYDLKPININGIILNAVREMKPLPKTLACEIDLENKLMNIMGGNAQIYRVIANLLHNARDAMQDIGCLRIKTENYYANDTAIIYGNIPKGEYTKLTISDSGCGIPEEMLDRIFDPFITTKTTDRKRGSGLGLSVVDAVVKDHKGYIDVKSKIGEGTSFYLYFPISRKMIDKQTNEQILGGDESVLIVDDDEIQRNVSMRILTKLGYNVSIASSGEEAVKIIRQTPHDVLVLDMVMPPGIDGTETYRQILNYNPDQKAIIVSGYSETEKVIEAQNLGAGAFVKKPLTSHAIASALRNELDKKIESKT